MSEETRASVQNYPFSCFSWIIIEPLELMAFRYIFPFMKLGDKKEQCEVIKTLFFSSAEQSSL